VIVTAVAGQVTWQVTPQVGSMRHGRAWGGPLVPGVLGETGAWEVLGTARVVASDTCTVSWWDGHSSEVVTLSAGEERRFAGRPVGYLTAGVHRMVMPRADRIDVVVGPDLDRFPSDALRRFVTTAWLVGETDRMGMRLGGEALPTRPERLPSAPMARGAVEVPPDGQPIVLGPDHPITGGYPLLAVVAPYAFGDLARYAPGETVRFGLVDWETARERLRRS
jgi:hypothetical protein